MKLGDNVLGSVHLSVRQPMLLQLNHLTYNPHHQSKVFVCNQWAFADNRADAVNWLLIFRCNDQL